MRPIYLDNHATTPVDPRVLEAMLPYFREKFGNAASKSHSYGKEASEAVEVARTQVASLIHADPKEILFTSGATEADNLAIKGAVRQFKGRGNHVVTVVTEHQAVLESCRSLEQSGEVQMTYLPVRADGLLDLEEFKRALTDRTVLVSVMAANGEIGVLQPIAQIGAMCRERGILFHTDAAQAAGKIPLDVDAMSVDLLSISAHKMYGPKGVGALFVRQRGSRVRLAAQMHGGGQEQGVRSGTLPVPLIVGFGTAASVAEQELPVESGRILGLRERLRTRLTESLDHLKINGSLEHRLPGNLHVSIEYVEGEALIQSLPGIALSAASACTTGTLELSHVLKALGVPETLIHNSIRFGIGRFNTPDEIDEVAEKLIQAVRKQRERSPLYREVLRDSAGR